MFLWFAFDTWQKWCVPIKMEYEWSKKKACAAHRYGEVLLPSLPITFSVLFSWSHNYVTIAHIHCYEIESEKSNENVTNIHNKGSERKQKQHAHAEELPGETKHHVMRVWKKCFWFLVWLALPQMSYYYLLLFVAWPFISDFLPP